MLSKGETYDQPHTSEAGSESDSYSDEVVGGVGGRDPNIHISPLSKDGNMKLKGKDKNL